MSIKSKSNVRSINSLNAKVLKQGGSRVGAGRPKGTGKYGEPTTAIRVPQSWADVIQGMLVHKSKHKDALMMGELSELWQQRSSKKSAKLPLFTTKIAAGFPSPADDHIETTLDLNEYLVEHPAATFFVRVAGESMLGAGINPDDILIVDKAKAATDGKIVIASINGELTVKRLKKHGAKVWLMPENSAFKPIEVTPETDFQIWGVVTSVIHQF